jgi:periplasmic divalent cation tolerance protein
MDHEETSSLIVISTCFPTLEPARQVAKICVEKRLAACAKVLPQPCESFYWWQGQVQTGSEFWLILKSSLKLYTSCELEIKKNHPFETPEIFALRIEKGSEDYLTWINRELRNSLSPQF